MASENKRAKRFNGRKEDEKLDRLSDLSDDLLHQIMWFLDIKTAVQTCVLSKRWDRLWVSVPDLDFRAHWDSYASFRKFVLNVLSTRADFNVGKFQINRQVGFDDYLFRKIIDHVVSHNVEHLELGIGYATLYRFLDQLKMSNSLKTLKLSHVIFGEHRFFGFGFKMLISLNLSYCRFYDTSDPFASFLNLKNLRLQNCVFSDRSRSVLKISGLQMLSLKIEYLESKVEILAPRLTSFSLKGKYASARCFSGLDLSSVSYAKIYFEEEYWSTRKQDVIVDALVIKQKNFINFFRSLYNAQVLTVSSTIIKDMDYVLGSVEQQPSPFKRLKSLKVQCKGKSIVIPARVRTYLLGDDPFEVTIRVEGGTDAETIVYVEFQKVQA